MGLFLIFYFVISFIASFSIVPFLIYIAKNFHIIDIPDQKLKKHSEAVPYLGGLGVFLGLFLPLIMSNFFIHINLFFILGLLGLTFLGLLDDVFVLSPFKKFIGQCIFVAILLASVNCLDILPFKFFNYFVSSFWILSIINAFNLIDVMDGLTSFVAIPTALSFLFYSIIFNQLCLAMVITCFIGAMIGFCYYNLPPAKIYLGDSGSLFVGGFLSIVSMMLDWQISSIDSLVISSIIMFVPILELISLIIIRFYKKIPFYLGSPDHFSIYLKEKGWGKYKILFYILSINIFLFFISILFYFQYIKIVGLISIFILFLCFWFYILMNKATKNTFIEDL